MCDKLKSLDQSEFRLLFFSISFCWRKLPHLCQFFQPPHQSFTNFTTFALSEVPYHRIGWRIKAVVGQIQAFLFQSNSEQKRNFFHFFAGLLSLCVEDRACPVISSKYLSKPSTHHTDAFFSELIKLWDNVLNTRVFFQGISYLLVFLFCFFCLSKSENLILVDCGESNWPVACFVSDSGYYSPGTNTPAATYCGKRFMPPKKSKKYILELQIIEMWLKPNWK